jgi:hypothetical protein
VFVVALTELRGPLEDEAAALARDLACTVYDARMLLVPGTPAILRRTPDREPALDLLSRVRARGHGAVACDLTAVTSSDAMTSMRRFRLGEEAVTLDDDPASRLPYDDVAALIPAVHRSRTDTQTVSRERKISIGRALMTSGLSMSKTVTKSSRDATEERENVLYVFRRSGGAPWFLREHGTAWTGHGQPLARSEAENFRIAVAVLREKAAAAAFDDRLVARKAPERAALSGAASTSGMTVKTSSDSGVDLLAHLLALALAKGMRLPLAEGAGRD